MEDIDDKAGIPILLNNIGVVYWRLNNFDKALEIYNESLNIVKELEKIKKEFPRLSIILD